MYNAWYQHRRENKIKNDPRVVVQHPTDAPIRPHHRFRNITIITFIERRPLESLLPGLVEMETALMIKMMKISSWSLVTLCTMTVEPGHEHQLRTVSATPGTEPRSQTFRHSMFLVNIFITPFQNYRDENRFTTTTTTSTTASTTTTASSVGLNDHMRSKMSQGASRRDHHSRGARNRQGLKSGG